MALSVTIEGVPIPRTSKRAPAKLVRGRRRHVLAKLVQHLQAAKHQDDRENLKGGKRHYTPYLIFGLPNGKVDKAYAVILAALQSAMMAKA